MGCCLLWANGPQESAQGASPGFCDHAPYRSRPRSEGAQETRRTGLNCAWPPCPLATLSCAHSGRALCARRLAGAGSQGSTRQGSARPGLTPSRRWRCDQFASLREGPFLRRLLGFTEGPSCPAYFHCWQLLLLEWLRGNGCRTADGLSVGIANVIDWQLLHRAPNDGPTMKNAHLPNGLECLVRLSVSRVAEPSQGGPNELVSGHVLEWMWAHELTS
jgi:hypothetical protein